jgi:hypothetical protein
MGTLRRAPTEADLQRLYHELAQLGAPAIGRDVPWPYDAKSPEALLALAGDMLRYDARLLSILLELVCKRWRSFNPLALREAMEGMAWPQALLVVFEFAREAAPDPELRYFVEYLAAGRPRVSPAERFFLDSDRPGSRVDRRRAARNLTAYARWGFIATERPTTSATRKTRVGRYDAATRRRIRQALADRRGAFAMGDYLTAVDHAVTRQQAYQDLSRDPDFERVGHGRGARWQRTDAP